MVMWCNCMWSLFITIYESEMEWSILSSFIHHKLITLFKNNNNNNNVQWRGYFKINLNPIKSLLFLPWKKCRQKSWWRVGNSFILCCPKCCSYLGWLGLVGSWNTPQAQLYCWTVCIEPSWLNPNIWLIWLFWLDHITL